MNGFIEKLIERLEEKRRPIVTIDEVLEWNRAVYACTKTVKKFAEEYNDGWIPCSKELPPQPKENPLFENKPLELYLVTLKNQDYPFRAFWNGKFFTDGWGKVNAIAWQPLPAPYQMKGE